MKPQAALHDMSTREQNPQFLVERACSSPEVGKFERLADFIATSSARFPTIKLCDGRGPLIGRQLDRFGGEGAMRSDRSSSDSNAH